MRQHAHYQGCLGAVSQIRRAVCFLLAGAAAVEEVLVIVDHVFAVLYVERLVLFLGSLCGDEGNFVVLAFDGE